MEWMTHYRKPAEICKYDPQYDLLTSEEDMCAFADKYLAEHAAYAESLGFRIRPALLSDIPRMKKLMAELFNAAAQKSAGEMYKMIRFGGNDTIVLEDGNGEILGFDLCTCYGGESRMALGNMVGVSLSQAGKRLGLVLEQYSCLGNMRNGMRVRGGGVKPNNYNSMFMLFNQVGYVGEVYLSGQLGAAEPRILLAFPLTPAGLTNNRIDLEKTLRFMDTTTRGKDYQTVLCEDFEAVQRMYAQTDFRVVAFLPKDKAAEENMLFALPKQLLNIPPEE